MKSIVMMNGSPRKKGTSVMFAKHMAAFFEAKGIEATIIHAIDYLDEKIQMNEIMALLDKADAVGYLSPLYVDSLPYPVLHFFEALLAQGKEHLQGKPCWAIIQCGFPDNAMMDPALESCRLFAGECGINWLGGIGYGGGAIINGTPLKELGKKGIRLGSALDMAADDVMHERKIRPEVQALMTERIPGLLLSPIAFYLNSVAFKKAKKDGINLKDRPYL